MSRSWIWAGCFAFTLLLGACGGGDGGLTTVTSDTEISPATSDNPEHLDAATPVTAVNEGGGQIEIGFLGDARALAEGGAYRFDVSVLVVGEGLKVTGNVRTTDGETVVDGRTVQDGEPTEDGSDVKTVTNDATVAWEWTDNNHLLITITTEDVTVPDTPPEVSVLAQKSTDTHTDTFTLYP